MHMCNHMCMGDGLFSLARPRGPSRALGTMAPRSVDDPIRIAQEKLLEPPTALRQRVSSQGPDGKWYTFVSYNHCFKGGRKGLRWREEVGSGVTHGTTHKRSASEMVRCSPHPCFMPR